MDLAALFVQHGHHVGQAGHHVGPGPDKVHHLGYQSGRGVVYPPVQSVQLGLHPVLVARLGHHLVCTGVRLGRFIPVQNP